MVWGETYKGSARERRVSRMRAMALLGKARTQWLLFSMSFLTRWLSAAQSSRTPFYVDSSTPNCKNCRAPMWDHYLRKDCIRACEHGCLKQISLGPFPGGNFARKGP